MRVFEANFDDIDIDPNFECASRKQSQKQKTKNKQKLDALNLENITIKSQDDKGTSK